MVVRHRRHDSGAQELELGCPKSQQLQAVGSGGTPLRLLSLTRHTAYSDTDRDVLAQT